MHYVWIKGWSAINWCPHLDVLVHGGSPFNMKLDYTRIQIQGAIALFTMVYNTFSKEVQFFFLF